MARRPKYQVFISSTYTDLHEEREAVVWKVLTARHIPVGMENFTAAHDRGWKTIQSVLDDTDYYVLILAGRYGSLDEAGTSWTQREYEYACSRGIPVLAFVRKSSHITKDKQDHDPKRTRKLEALVETIRSRHLTVDWENAEDLAGAVVDALRNHILDDEGTENERPGWYRGTDVPTGAVTEELARLSAQNADFRAQLEAHQAGGPDIVLSHCKLHLLGEGYLPLLNVHLTSVGHRVVALLTVDIRVHGVDFVDYVQATYSESGKQRGGKPEYASFVQNTKEDGHFDLRLRMAQITPNLSVAMPALGIHAVKAGPFKVELVMTDENGHQWKFVEEFEIPANYLVRR